MTSIDLSTHNKAISEAYREIVTGVDGKLNWLVCGYEGKTNSLKLVETGDDGLEGLAYALSDSQVQYAFARVVDPKSGLPKYVYIVYSGEGAPIQRKGQVTTHQIGVGKLLHGYHVEINARSEADIDPDIIMEKVMKASGAFYSAHKDHLNQTTRITNETEPPKVGTVYQKAEVVSGRAGDIKAQIESGRSDNTSSRIEEERRAREEKDAADRARDVRERQMAEEKTAAAEKNSRESADAARRREEEQREAALLAEREAAESTRRAQEEEARQRAIQEEEEEQQRLAAEAAAAAAQQEQEEAAYDGPTATEYGEAESGATGDYGTCAVAMYDYDAAEDNELTFREGDYITNIEVIDDGWWTGVDKDGKTGMFPANFVELATPPAS